MLFDNNSLNIGKRINGSKILPGSSMLEEYHKKKFTVLITSLIHEAGIRKQIEKLFEGEKELPEIIGFKKLLQD
jgi:hypothetical protein